MVIIEMLEKIVDRYNELSPLYKVIVLILLIIIIAVGTYNLISTNVPFRIIH